MTTKQIDYCIELARTLNFGRAAENQFVSQPTLTYQIKLLEEEIGFRIFERSGKGASLTPAGEQFVTYLSGMREGLKRAIEQGQNFSVRYKDSITISLMVRQAVYFLPEAMRLFEKDCPDVQIIPKFQPIAWDKLRFKLNCAVRTGHDKLITYEFTPFLSPYGCYKTWTESLLARYREWCETESRS